MIPFRTPRVTPPAAALTPAELDRLSTRLSELRREALAAEERHHALLGAVHPQNLLSARNLVHYLTLRRSDMRDLQNELAWLGLSSLGRSEARVLVSLDRVLGMLALARGATLPPYDEAAPVGFRQGEELVELHADQLLGPARDYRRVRIAVTLPAEAGGDPAFCRQLVAAGMDVARVNCAHGNAAEWKAMIACVREASEALGRPVHVFMDLAGPKLRLDSVGEGEDPVRLRGGDRLLLLEAGRGLPDDGPDEWDVVATCPVPEVLRDGRPGDPIWFDDGKVGGRIDASGVGWLRINVTHARPGGTKLRAGKGINLPQTRLGVAGLRDEDLGALTFAADQADAVALSFVQDEADVIHLQGELAARGRPALGIILKIETRTGFENLPRLLLTAMRSPRYGVMIARGDLAVEMGFERLAEVQEEILWVAEAAHAPTVWATQVLESLAKHGAPSRAEVTDAAMSGRAEAVMLNKGAYIVDAIEALDDILGRMEQLQDKKRPLLRPLGMSGGF